MSRWILLFLLMSCSPAAWAETAATAPEPIWQDEFDGPAGQLPDPARWVFDLGTDWGNKQLEWTTDHPANVSLDGQGNLAITARREEFQGQPYTAARIKTKGLFEFTYGRVEARIKLPEGQGIWPAFWMLGADIDQVGWPHCGEIDVMEFLGQDVHTSYGTIHGPGHAGDDSIGDTFRLADGAFNEDFHIFTVDWSSREIVWSVDGREYHRVERAGFPEQARWVYDHDFFMLLNVAVGGRWPGNPDATTTFPQTMLVDYVRVYAP